MLELFSGVTPLMIFLGITAIGFCYLVISLVIGDWVDHDADLDHDVATDHSLTGGGHEGPSFVNSRVISVIITAFGALGAIATYAGVGVLVSSLCGLIGGLALGWLVYAFGRFLYSQQASSEISVHDLLGQLATVTVTIPRNGLGQVRCVVGESVIEKIARSDDGSEIPFSTLVRIDDIQPDFVVVRRADVIDAEFTVGRLFDKS